jgi:hypothetical protein
MFFQQLKRLHEDFMGSAPNTETNFGLGAIAAAVAVCVMIPVDTIKTRLVIQVYHTSYLYCMVTNDILFIAESNVSNGI